MSDYPDELVDHVASLELMRVGIQSSLEELLPLIEDTGLKRYLETIYDVTQLATPMTKELAESIGLPESMISEISRVSEYIKNNTRDSLGTKLGTNNAS